MRAKKRYGQHFLEGTWADRLVEAIAPQRADRFLEIGPGLGALTLRLARRVDRIIAVEVDPAMVAALDPRLPANASLVRADFLDFDVASLAASFPLRVAGNLPYNVSSPILFALIDGHRRRGAFTDATVMVQREVADRILAGPGGREYGVLSILIQLHADVRLVLSLPPGAFRPAPRVRSAVVHLTFRPPAVPLVDEAAFGAMVRSMFTQRRKTLGNALRPYADSRGRQALDTLMAAGIDPKRRPETLQLQELARLAETFVPSGE